MRGTDYDAVVVGAGPNGLCAAATLATEGARVLVVEAGDTIGGGSRSTELTLPGFVHDVCSTVHPLGAASPAFRALRLEELGLEWVHPEVPLAHVFDDGTAALLERSIARTAATLGPRDAEAYRTLLEPFVERWEDLAAEILAPLHLPRHPLLLARFGLKGIRSARALVRSRFRDGRARALFTGIAGHTLLPARKRPTAAFGLLLALLGHAVGWPVARGGSQRIVDALAQRIRAHGGEITTGWRVRTVDELPGSRAVLLDLTPRQILEVAGHRLPGRYRRALRHYRYGPGTFRLEWALSAPIPWRSPEARRAGTVHVGGAMEEVERARLRAWNGELPERPFVIVVQATTFDPTRAPAGRHTGYALCRIPHGSDADVTDRVEAQVERFAPGFRDTILARVALTPLELQRYNSNLVGGDVGGGIQSLDQLFTRPAARPVPYSTPVHGLFVCSSSTPPGGGVHGMCGYHAARAALRMLR